MTFLPSHLTTNESFHLFVLDLLAVLPWRLTTGNVSQLKCLGEQAGALQQGQGAAQDFACLCLWHAAGKWKVMQISGLITSTPLLYPEASSFFFG